MIEKSLNLIFYSQNKKNFKIIEQVKKEKSEQDNSSSFQNNSQINNNHSFSTQKA